MGGVGFATRTILFGEYLSYFAVYPEETLGFLAKCLRWLDLTFSAKHYLREALNLRSRNA